MCGYLHKADILYMLDAFEKNKPHLEINSEAFSLREIKSFTSDFNPFKNNQTPTNSKSLKCLQMRAFDRNENKSKCLEVFLVEKIQDSLDLIIKCAKESLELTRTDLFLNIYDYYFLDNNQLFFVIEYEHYEFSQHDYNQLSKQEMDNINTYKFKIYLYCKEQFYPYSKKNPLLYQRVKDEQIDFVFQKNDDSTYRIKIYTVDPFLFHPQSQKESDKIQKEKLREKGDTRYLSSSVSSSLELELFLKDFLINKEDLLRKVNEKYPKLMKYHGKMIFYVINLYSEQDQFLLQNNNDNKFSLKVISSSETSVLRGQKFNSLEEAQKTVKKYEEMCQELTKQQIQTIITNYEIITLEQYEHYILFKIDYSLMNSALNLNSYQEIILSHVNIQNLIRNILYFPYDLFEYQLNPNQIFINQKAEFLFDETILDKDLLSSYPNDNSCFEDTYSEIVSQLFEILTKQYILTNPSNFLKEQKRIISAYFKSLKSKDISRQQLLNQQLTRSLDEANQIDQISSQFSLNLFKISFSEQNIGYIEIKTNLGQVASIDLKNFMQKMTEKTNFIVININQQILLLNYQFNYLIPKFEKIFKKNTSLFQTYLKELEIPENQNRESIKYIISKEIEEILNLKEGQLNKHINNEQKIKLKELTIKSIEDNYEMINFQFKLISQEVHNRFNCFYGKPDLLFTREALIKRIISSIQLLKFQELFGDSCDSSCYNEDSNRYILALAQNQTHLQKFVFYTECCQGVKEQLTKQSDYFGLKTKQRLYELHIFEKYLEEISQQIRNNKNNINYILLKPDDKKPFHFLLPETNLTKLRPIYKLPRIVKISKSQQ